MGCDLVTFHDCEHVCYFEDLDKDGLCPTCKAAGRKKNKEIQMTDFRKSMVAMTNTIHDMAKKKGWWVTTRSPLEIHALIHSEVSEAVEEARVGTPAVYQTDRHIQPHHGDWDSKKKPEGELIELADVVIRIMDYCGQRGWDLGEAIEMKVDYNGGRDYRHGGKLY